MKQLKKLLLYLKEELTIQELEEVEVLLKNNPAYFEILGGLALMKKEFGDDEGVYAHLKEVKETMREKLFSDAMENVHSTHSN